MKKINFIDIKMGYDTQKGYFDISSTPNGDIEVDESFDTSIHLALQTDGRADNSEVNKVELQRGTIVDLFTNSRNGSKLWLLEQARGDFTAKNRAVDYARNALKYLIDEGYCRDITVEGKLTEKGITLYITIERINGVFDKYRYDAWNKSLYVV